MFLRLGAVKRSKGHSGIVVAILVLALSDSVIGIAMRQVLTFELDCSTEITRMRGVALALSLEPNLSHRVS